MKVELTDSDDVSTVDGSCCPQSPPDTSPLDLTKRRESDTEPRRTNTSPSDAVAELTTSHVTTTQILLLKGQRYEILPIGGGRWMWRAELQNGDDDGRRLNQSEDDDDDQLSVASLDKPHISSRDTAT